MRMYVPLVAYVGLCWVVQDVGAQQITGRVVSTSGEPLAAVQVYIAGSGIGALTQQNGRYLLLSVPVGTHAVTAVRIGYQTVTREITVTAGQTVVQDITLSEQALGLDELVVTGTAGGTRRRAVGNAVTTMDVASELLARPAQSVNDLLTGKTPGVTIMGMGTVGSGGNIRIRGQSTFSLSSNPLVFVDGVRVSNAENTGLFDDAGAGRSMMGTIDPSEIQSMEILKGPSAATLYGTEASRGVINIVTKKGQQGGRTANLSVRQGVNFVGPNALDIMGGVKYWKSKTGQVQTLDFFKFWDEKGKNPFGYGQIQEYNLSVGGGTPTQRYFISTSYSDEQGYLISNWAKRFSLRANTEADLGADLRLALSTGYSQTTSRLPVDGFNDLPGAYVFATPRYLAENYCKEIASKVACEFPDGAGYGTGANSPAKEAAQDNRQGVNRFTGSATASYDPLTWLSNRLVLGLDFANEDNTNTLEYQTDPGLRVSFGGSADGYREILRNQRLLTTADFATTAQFSLTSSLASTASVGFQYYTRTTISSYTRGDGFPAPGLKVVDAARITTLRKANDAGDQVLSDNRLQDRTLGMYVQETLAWRDRLFLTGALRMDNNSAFGSDIKFVTYPKASVSWVLNEEDWYESVMPSWLSALRFRLAYGQSGEQPPASAADRSYTPVPSPQGGGITTFTAGNPNLAPEVGEEIETGFDADLLAGRLGLEATYYHTRTKGAILRRDSPPSTGFSQPVFVNLGQVSGQGFEIGIDAQAAAIGGFRWNLNGHAAYSESAIDRLGDDPADTTIVYGIWNLREHRVGYAPHSWFQPRMVSAEWDPARGRIVNVMCDDGRGGTMACYAANGSVAAPRLYLGRTIAPWELGLSSQFAFRDAWRLNVHFISNQGAVRFDNNMRQRYGGFANTRANVYPEEASPRELMRLAAAQSGDAVISPYVYDVSFIRLQDVVLSWTLPRERVQAWGMSGASLELAAHNVWTFTSWEDTDPTVSRGNGDDRNFYSQHMNPTPTSIATSLRVTF